MAKKLQLEKLNNTRELGGLIGANGKSIKEDKLYRSGHLFFATENDLDALESLNLSHIIDLRSPLEQEQKPDPEILGVKHIALPTVTDELAGITRDQSSDREASQMIVMQMAADKKAALQYMDELYENLVTNDFCLSQYNRFLNILADDKSDKVLWHCTAGKDRAGLATVFTLEILGVNRDDIIENYLETNKNLKGEVDEIIEMMRKKLKFEGDEDSVRTFFGAMPEYIDSMYRKVFEMHGNFENFIRNGLGINDETVEIIRNKFLV